MGQLSATYILWIVAAYFLVLILISYFTGKSSSNKDFFLAGRKSPWYLVAFGMIGASLSGVTFISIPGAIGASPELLNEVAQNLQKVNGTNYKEIQGLGQKSNTAFSYMQMVFGYLVGYLIIATVLMPMYYKKNLTSIYGYLEERFGVNSYKIGAFFFLLSRTIGAAFRLFLVAIVFQFIFDKIDGLNVQFWQTVLMTILLIWLYTFRGGIKTIVITDTLQTLFMLVAVVMTVVYIGSELNANSFGEIKSLVSESSMSKMFYFDKGWSDPNNFWKMFISGALISLVMTGLDQDMMQKNLSCKSLGDAQKNMFSFSIVLVFVNVLFISLGVLLYLYASEKGISLPAELVEVEEGVGKLVYKGDRLYPLIAIDYLPWGVGVVFILGLIAAAYSSADSALTALTTSFCVDFLNFEKNPPKNELAAQQQKRTRFMVHIGFSLLLFFVILIFNTINDQSVITEVFIAAGYTYGPILGLYAFGFLTKRAILDKWVIPICLAAPALSYIINLNSKAWFNGFTFGFMILALNGLLTFLGLLAISKSQSSIKA